MTAPVTSSDLSARGPGAAVVAGLCICAALWLTPRSASTTVMEYTSPTELVALSDVVVRADVVERQSFVDERRERIVTHTTLAIREHYSGDPSAEITVEQWGGTVGERTSRVPGDAEFEVGEEVVVFLRRDDTRPDVLFLTALAQSKYTVDRGTDSAIVARDLSDLVVLEADGDRDRLTIDGELHGLAEFEARLRELIEERTESGR